MNKLLFIFLAFNIFIISCREQEVESPPCIYSEQDDIIFPPSTVSVCHNPNSKNHNKICTLECYELGETTAYCYDLPTEVCNEGWDREPWVDDVCKELIKTLQ